MSSRAALLSLLLAVPAAAVETSIPSLDIPRLPAASAPAMPAALAPMPGKAPVLMPVAPPEAAAPQAPAAIEQARVIARPAAQPQAEPARQQAFFDGAKAPAPEAAPEPQAEPASFAPKPPAPESLLEKAKPWRPENQLAKLSQSGPRAPGEGFRFAVIGDAEPGRFWIWRALFNHPGVFGKLLAAADKSKADFIVQLGDMVSRGSVKNFGKFFDLLKRVNPVKPYLTVIGNHDRRKPHGVTDSRLYRALFGPTDYHFDRGGVRFIVLDSSSGHVMPEQLRWLDGVLDTPLRKVIMTHMPPIVLRPWTRVPGLPTDGGLMAGGFRKGAKEFTQLASRRGVERVYVGHVHGFGVLDYKGVRYVLTGGGGSPLFPSPVHERFHHYLTVDVQPGGLVETVHKEDGTTFRIPAVARP